MDDTSSSALEQVWRLVWHEEPPPPKDQRQLITQGLLTALASPAAAPLLAGTDWPAARSVYFMYGAFKTVIAAVCADLGDLDEALRTFPSTVLRCTHAALSLLRARRCPAQAVALVQARFLCVSPLDSFASIDSEAVNTLVSVRGLAVGPSVQFTKR